MSRIGLRFAEQRGVIRTGLAQTNGSDMITWTGSRHNGAVASQSVGLLAERPWWFVPLMLPSDRVPCVT
ncbi:hypothetical protein CCR97_16645 [Rhodoplanes elegans]|nr:hypothetical protein [Rhodoplanes elegans]